MTGEPIESATLAGRPLLTAKLAVAPLPVDPVVARPRLLDLLDQGVRGPLTVLTAPAGYGKSVLLGAWGRTRGGPVGWLTVEPGDDGARLWPYLSMAVRPVGPGPPPESDDGARDGTDLPIDVPQVILDGPLGADFLEQLAIDLAGRPEPVTLIVDDLHLVADEAFPAGLEFLLRHAGQRLRLVVAARTEPALGLHRRRLAGGLTEIGAADLAFTPAEVVELLAGQGLRLPTEQVAELCERTEGWPAGLRLAALGLRGHPDPRGFIAGFGGDHPAVAAYLAEAVLAGFDERTLDALTRLSGADHLTPELCDAVTGRSDGGLLLAEAARSAGFLSADCRRPGYRMHRMFAESLRARLRRWPADDLIALHARLSDWSVRTGAHGDALRHALHSRRWRLAADLLARHWPELVPLSRDHDRAAPPPAPEPEQVRANPGAGLAYALERLAAGDPAAAARHLTPVDPAGGPDRWAEVRAVLELVRAERAGEFEAVRAGCAALLSPARPDPPATGAPATGAPATGAPAGGAVAGGAVAGGAVAGGAAVVGGPVRPGSAVRAVVRGILGGELLAAGELAGAQVALAAGTAECATAGLPRAELICSARLALTVALSGRLTSAAELARRLLATSPADPERAGTAAPLAAGYAHLALAVVALRRDRLTEAEAELTAATAVPGGTDEPGLAVHAAWLRAELERERGDPVAAYRAVRDGLGRLTGRAGSTELADRFALLAEELRASATPTGSDPTRPDLAGPDQVGSDLVGSDLAGPNLVGPDLVGSNLVGSNLAGPDLVGPDLVGSEVVGRPGSGAPTVVRAVATAGGLLRAGDAAAAARTLPDWAGPTGTAWPLDLRIEAGLLDALAARAVGDHRRAARTLERVLELAEPDGHRRVFRIAEPAVRDLLTAQLDAGTAYWATVLELIGAHRHPAAAAAPAVPSEPLTERELTILRYLQSILSNVEIAAELSLSVNTVKTHVRNIYRKLDATRRRDAVRRARELRLL